MDILVRGGLFRKMRTFLNFTNPLLITDSRLSESIDIFKRMYPNSTIYDKILNEPTIEDVKTIQKYMDNSIDCIVALGGGSPIDAAKAANIGFSNRGFLSKNKVPLIAVPTTAGTGAEVTPFSVIKVGEEKVLISNNLLIPSISIIDYELTLSKPPMLTAMTGMDALCHSLEAFVSKKNNPKSDKYAIESLKKIGESLRQSVLEPTNISREKMMLGSLEAGLAFSNSSVTLVHGMSRPLGRYNIPHGMANAQLVVPITDFSYSGAKERYEIAKNALSPNDSRDIVTYLHDLVNEIGIPDLKDSVNETEFNRSIPDMVNEAMKSGSPNNNPRPITNDEMELLYKNIIN